MITTAKKRNKTNDFGFSERHFRNWPEWIQLNVNTGLRLREMLFLEWSDVDLSAGVLHIRNKKDLGFHPKSHQERRIPLNKEARSSLRRLQFLRHPDSEWVFHKPDGTQWKSVRQSFENLVEDCKLKEVTLHTMRHSFASALAQRGVSLRAIQLLLGHSSIEITEKYYAHLSRENLSDAVQVLEALPKTLLIGRESEAGIGVTRSAEKRTRTSTGLPPLDPESSASANSAISA